MCFSIEVETDEKKIAALFDASAKASERMAYNNLKARDQEFFMRALDLPKKPRSPFLKEPNKDHRVFPNYFTWVMVMENGKRVLKKMRYRVRPRGSKHEIKSTFNVFNARLDSLKERWTWKHLYMRNHGLVPFYRFFEWVEDHGKKRLITFAPTQHKIMWAPCLWDRWESPTEDLAFSSFAIITDDPPAEVSEMGHDRCPIFLREDLIDAWLDPKGKSEKEVKRILKAREEEVYENQWAA